MAKDALTAGFTGTPVEPPTGVRKMAKTATDAARREANVVAAAVADHPRTASGLLLTVGALAFAIGFVIGRSSIDGERGYSR